MVRAISTWLHRDLPAYSRTIAPSGPKNRSSSSAVRCGDGVSTLMSRGASAHPFRHQRTAIRLVSALARLAFCRVGVGALLKVGRRILVWLLRLLQDDNR